MAKLICLLHSRFQPCGRAYLFIAFQVSAVWQSLFVYCIPGFSRVAELICLLHSRFQPCGRAYLFIAFQVSAMW